MVLLKEQFEEAKKKYKIKRKAPTNKRKPFREKDTGFIRTRKIYCQSCKKKFTYRYKWFDIENDKYRVISCVDFICLKNKIKDRGLEWGVDDYSSARKTAREVGLPLRDLK